MAQRFSAGTALLLICVLLGAVDLRAQSIPERSGTARRYAVERWTHEEGLPNQSLSGVMYGRDGYLWIATLAGVSRFDGVRFTPILTNLPNAHVRVLFQDSRAVTWAGLVGGGLARYGPGQLKALSVEQLGSTDVWAVTEDSAGRIWIGLEDGVAIIDGTQISRLGQAEGLPGRRVSSLIPGQATGSMWVATNAAVCEIRGLRPRCVSAADARGRRGLFGATQENVVVEGVLLHDRDRRLWVGGSRGLFSMGEDFAPTSPCADGCFRGEAVTSLLETSGGRVVVGHASAAMSVIDDGVVERYRSADGLLTGPIVGLDEDAEGSLWAAVYNGGLQRLRPHRLRMYSTSDGLPAKVAGSIVQDREGTIWAASQCGPVSVFRDGRFVPRFVRETAGTCPLSLLAARDGALWIGTDKGLFRHHQGRTEHFGRRQGLSDDNVRALFEDRDDVIWIGTLYGKLHRFERGQLSRGYGTVDGVTETKLQSFAQDHDGRVWIGSNGVGLSVYEQGRFRVLRADEAPAERDITGLLVDSRGDLWVSTDRAGVYRRRDGRFEQFGPAQGIGDPLVSLMLEDRSAVMWFATARGITRIERDQIDALSSGRTRTLHAAYLDRVDGMLNPEVSGGGFDPTGLRDRDGRLWFSTIDGIAVIDPSTFPLNRIEPKVVVESAVVNGAMVADLSGGLRIEAGGPPLELSYTGLSLFAPRKARFRYRLQGFDVEWTEAGNRRTAYYPHLPPGTYQFEVMAANNDGVWSREAATLTVTVAPFWWERASVRAVGLLGLLTITGLVVRAVSVRRADQRLRDLEREHAIDRERRRIAQDLHDDIGARLTQMAMMADRGGGADGHLSMAARGAIQAMDELVWTVSAKHDTVESLLTYCVAYAEEYLRTAGIRMRLDVPTEVDHRPLGADVRRHVFLWLKEVLNNIVKHADAHEVRLVAEVRSDNLHLLVSDDGKGFDAAAGFPTGNGLAGLRERAAAVGGRCEINSWSGGGTRVHIHVSLPGPHV